MRFASRFFLEDPKAFLTRLKARGFKEDALQRLRQNGTTILQQPVRTPAAAKAIAGGSGTLTVEDYRGVPVLSSLAPLQRPICL